MDSVDAATIEQLLVELVWKFPDCIVKWLILRPLSEEA